MTIRSSSEAETLAWAEEFGRGLRAPAVVALVGDLGAGKTVVARGIGKGLNVREAVISPTFNYVLEYRGRVPLYHADLYRIDTSRAFQALGLDEYFDRDGVFVIEWSERIRDLLPPSAILVTISEGKETDERLITVTGPNS